MLHFLFLGGGRAEGEPAELSLGAASPSIETHIYHDDIYWLWQSWSTADFPAAEAKLQAAHNAVRCCWGFSQWKLGECSPPSHFLWLQSPGVVLCMQSPCSFDPVWTWLTPQAPVWKNASPTTLGRVPNTQTRALSVFRGLCFCFPEWGLFAHMKWSIFRHIYIIFKTEEEGENCPISYTTLFRLSEVKWFMPGQVSQKHKAIIPPIGDPHYSSTNNGEKMWFPKQTGRKSSHPPWECV